MNRKENFQLLSKFNILKGYLIDEVLNTEEVLKIAQTLFNENDKKDLIQKIKDKHFSEALNLLNNYMQEINNCIFRIPCDKSWNDLIRTNNSNTKFCLYCRKNVYLVNNEKDFLKRKNLQQCVALNTHDFKPDEISEKNFKSCRIKFYDEPELGLPF